MTKTMKLIGIIFTIIGLVFGGVGAGLAAYAARESQGMQRVDGAIIAFDGRYPIISYSVDGKAYHLRPHSTSSSMRLGDRYTLLVDPDDPRHTLDSGTFVLLSSIFGGIGVVFLLVGATSLVIMARSRRHRELLLSIGSRVSATVTDVQVDRTMTVNGRHPDRLIAICRNPVSYEEMTVRSHALWHVPYAPGDRVDVLFDPMDPKKYVFDVPEESE